MDDIIQRSLKTQGNKYKVIKMNEIVSFRFRPHELSHIRKMSIEQKLDRTAAARELIEYGWMYYVLLEYKKGRLSLETTAKELHLPLTDLLDLLADFGIKSPINYEDYLESLKNI